MRHTPDGTRSRSSGSTCRRWSSSRRKRSSGFRFLYERAKLACEAAGAAAVAAVLAGKVNGGRTVCVVSGGNVAAETAAGILAGR